MYFTSGNYSMGGNFRIKKQAPIDDRSTVAKKADLQNPNLFDGFTYNGMIVSVVDDTELNNGVYRLKNKTTLEWKLLGEGSGGSTSFATEEEVIAGVVVDKAISPLRLKANNYNKTEVDTKISNLILQNTGYNVFELSGVKIDEEVKTAERWADGKPIWRKVIRVTGMPVGTKDIAHNITGFSDIWIDHSKSFMYWNSGFGSAPITRSSGTATKVDSEVLLINNKTTVRLSSVYDFSTAVVTICICFTKTNEDITTPVSQVPVILEGLSELPSPKLGVETKTAMRHPVSGKPLYTKTIDCGFLPAAAKTAKVVPLGIADAYDYVKVLTDSSHIVIPSISDFSFSVLMPWYTLESQIGAYIESGSIVIGVGMGQSNKKAYITVEYTKTADNNTTPTALIGGNGKDAYETYLETTSDVPVKTKVEWLQSLIGEIKFETLTEDQKEQLLRSEVKYGMWSVNKNNIANYSMTPDVTKLPVFNTKITGNLVANDETTFLLRKNRVYKIEFSIGLNNSNSNWLRFALYNNDTNTMISNNPTLNQSPSSTNNYVYDSFYSEYIRVDVDTPISLRLENNNNTKTAYVTLALAYYTKISIMEISTREMILSDFSINGKKFDENNNIDLEGLSTVSNPVLNQEILTERRHPISGKPLYIKTINFGSLPNNTTKKVNFGVPTIEDANIVHSQSYVYNTSTPLIKIPTIYISPTSGSNLTAGWGIYSDADNISIITGMDRTSYIGIVTVEYTKTTDTAESPVRLVGGTGKGPYEIWLSLGNVGSEEDYLATVKGQRGLPGPKGKDGTVTFNDLTDEQKEELVKNKNIRTRLSNNLLYYNKNNNASFIDLTLENNMDIKNVKVTTNADVVYDLVGEKVETTPNDIGYYKYLTDGEYKTDIFNDNSCLAYFPLRNNLKSLDNTYEFIQYGDEPIVYSSDVIKGNSRDVFDRNGKLAAGKSDSLNNSLTVTNGAAISLYIKNIDNSALHRDLFANKYIMVYLYQGRIYIHDLTKGYEVYYYTNVVFVNSEWTHIVINLKPNLVDSDIYVNGVLSPPATKFNTVGENKGVNSFYIGYHGVESAGLRVGVTYFSMLRIFNRNLNTSEIATLGNSINKKLVELYHGSGDVAKTINIESTTINLNIPHATNENEAMKLGLAKGDLFISGSTALSVLNSGNQDTEPVSGVYGIRWDYNTDTYIRTGASDYTFLQRKMRRCVMNADGTVKYYLHKDNSIFKEDGSLAILDGSDGNVMVEVPKAYINIANINSLDVLEISSTPAPGLVCSSSHIDENGNEVDFRYFRAYECVIQNGVLKSVSGATPTTKESAATFRTAAKANGAVWGVTDWSLITLIRIFLYIEFCDYIATKYLGEGNTSGTTGPSITGLSNHLGNNSSKFSANKWMSYRGIENLYGDLWELVDGINIKNAQPYINKNRKTFNHNVFTGDYVATGLTLPNPHPSGSYIKRHHLSNSNGFIPLEANGSETTRFGDATWTTTTGETVCHYGGSYSNDKLAGPSALATTITPDNNTLLIAGASVTC